MRLNGYKIFAGLAFTAMLAAVFAPAAGAQGFPARAVRYIMPLPAGSETDVFARTLARQLGENWNQQVVVENRPGGGTTIGSDIVAKAPADGYTLLVTGSAHWIGPLLEKANYDAIKDFAAITLVDRAPNILVVHPSGR